MSHTHGLPHRLAPNRRLSERKKPRLVPFIASGVYHILFAILTTLHMVVKYKNENLPEFFQNESDAIRYFLLCMLLSCAAGR